MFKETAYGDGVTEYAAGGLGHVVPIAVGLAVLVGIGEEDNAVAFEWAQLGDIEFGLAARGQSDIFRFHLGHNHRGLLGFDYGHFYISHLPSDIFHQ